MWVVSRVDGEVGEVVVLEDPGGKVAAIMDLCDWLRISGLDFSCT